MALRSRVAAVNASALLALVGLALPATGCGSEKRLTKTDYEQRVRSIYDEVRKAFQGTGTKVPSLDALAGRVRVAQQELRRAAEELSKLEAPKEIEEQNHEIAEGLDAYADDLDRLREAAARGDSRRVRVFEEGIPKNESIHRVEEAAEEIKAKGYDLGALTSG